MYATKQNDGWQYWTDEKSSLFFVFKAILFLSRRFILILTSDDSDDLFDRLDPCYYPSKKNSNIVR